MNFGDDVVWGERNVTNHGTALEELLSQGMEPSITQITVHSEHACNPLGQMKRSRQLSRQFATDGFEDGPDAIAFVFCLSAILKFRPVEGQNETHCEKQ
jgi:hypothetical protein